MSEISRVALITGCGKQDGIGAAIARRLAAAGCKLVVTDIEAEGARDRFEPDAGEGAASWRGVTTLVDEICCSGGSATCITGDISNVANVEEMVAQAIAAYGSIDILVNNAGAPFSMAHGNLDDIPIDEFERVMAINICGTFQMARKVAPYLRQQKWGRIVNIASVAGRVGSKLNSAYAASKAGVIALSQTWALELGPYGVTSNAVLPGFIFTNRSLSGMRKKLGGAELDQGAIEKMMPNVPVGRPGRAEDVASMVAFLASEEAGYVNGQSLIVDGGNLRL
ncbi:SDR family oxidoreductase [Croceicoccus ponticola]|uniref:SDR family oxidoreductase n=1 Tax=Croceicoccus ponticola TaxID=2217664 RepID=A0A437H283_9SPHN|nr:SDR family NAD(P)-dependent oxidoreductase [Croceicoccus ponticola]RVQ69656.1 SDR family oxidoreductase [Croceicoccus ponticola]